MLLTLFAVTAVSLACIGIYGTLSYLGRLRQREVGVRLALGSTRSRIVAGFLFQGLRVAVIGCIAGLALGLGLTHFLAGDALRRFRARSRNLLWRSVDDSAGGRARFIAARSPRSTRRPHAHPSRRVTALLGLITNH